MVKIGVSAAEDPKHGWRVPASKMSKDTFNPIRNILESMDLKPNPRKKMISLSIGDPTVFGNLKPDEVIVEAVRESLVSQRANFGSQSTYGSPNHNLLFFSFPPPLPPRVEQDSGRYNGYTSSVGYPEAREAVAEHVSYPGAEITAEDVVLCSGCSCSLDLAISVLADPGDNILVR